MAEHEEELKSLLMRVKGECEKAGLKLNIQKMVMASSPITSWQTEGEIVETMTDFIFVGSRITAVTAFMKLRRLFFGIKAMTNLDSTLKAETPLC